MKKMHVRIIETGDHQPAARVQLLTSFQAVSQAFRAGIAPHIDKFSLTDQRGLGFRLTGIHGFDSGVGNQ